MHPTSGHTTSTPPDQPNRSDLRAEEAEFSTEIGPGVEHQTASSDRTGQTPGHASGDGTSETAASDAVSDGPAATDKPAAEDGPFSADAIGAGATNTAAMGSQNPDITTHEPPPALLLLALVGILIGALGGLTLVNNPQTRYAGLALVFFSGALCVWRMMVDDRKRDRQALAMKDEKLRRLLARCEELEDTAWELRESDERQASILSTLGDIVLRRDDDNTVVYANAAADVAFGPRDRVLTGCILSLNELATHPTGTAAKAGAMSAAVASPTTNEMASSGPEGSSSAFSDRPIAFGDVELKTRFGARWFSRMDIHVRDTTTDQPLVQTVLRDVTDRREMEDELLAARHSAESSNEAKSRFLATVSHEIRTPLNGILGMATLLRDTRLTKEQGAYIEALETSGETLLLLIDEVLDFSKVEAGKLHIEANPTRLTSIIANVVELLAPKAHGKGLELGSFIAPGLPETVTLDSTRVRQILFNLAGNGVKFTEHGGVSIQVHGAPAEDGGSLLTIEVRDTGIGFQQGDADRLFEEFEQLDRGRARKFGGTGLGLAIARRLTELMHGSISADSAPEGGALFRVCLPVPEEMVATDATSTFAGKTIVLIGSGPVEMPLLAERLTSQGARAKVFSPGDPALDNMLVDADLVIADNSTLSDSAGWLATARLCGCQARAVVLVSPSERDRLDRLREAGYSAYLIRPVRMESLVSVVEGLMANDVDDQCWVDFSEPRSLLTQSRISFAPSRPMKLLVAEDNDINRLLTDALLRKLGHEATLVPDGEQAVEAASSAQFDAILMDLHMPGLDGIAAIRRIREVEAASGATSTPVFMVTADVMEDAKQKAANAGAAGYLTKPLTVEAIETALNSLPKGTTGLTGS
ncbi:response regulator [Roseibium sp.]|uniref:response regulator n=1 Tax=Roseibium sp. TaxID=1936156 RepID=UPI003A96A264